MITSSICFQVNIHYSYRLYFCKTTALTFNSDLIVCLQENGSKQSTSTCSEKEKNPIIVRQFAITSLQLHLLSDASVNLTNILLGSKRLQEF